MAKKTKTPAVTGPLVASAAGKILASSKARAAEKTALLSVELTMSTEGGEDPWLSGGAWSDAAVQTQLRELVRAAVAVDGAVRETDVLGLSDPDEVAMALEGWVASTLGSVTSAIFYARSVGLTAGLVADGWPVVIKARHWRSSPRSISAQQELQRHLRAVGLPVPEPLAGPDQLGRGWVSAETLLPWGMAGGHADARRQSMASGLAALVDAASRVDLGGLLGPAAVMEPRSSGLWPLPHDARFDFEETSEGAEWIDEQGERARAILDAADADEVTGHMDWRVENLGWSGAEIVGIFDWDSVGSAPEAVVAGCAAATHTTDWRSRSCHVPTASETRAFLSDYQASRGRRFGYNEMDLAEAAVLWTLAYGARCEHSDARRGLASAGGDPVRTPALENWILLS